MLELGPNRLRRGKSLDDYVKTKIPFLLWCICFDDQTIRDHRKMEDKLTAVREVLDIFVKKCKHMYNVSNFVKVDKMLPPFCGRCSFKQYIPSKPSKYGIKLFA